MSRVIKRLFSPRAWSTTLRLWSWELRLLARGHGHCSRIFTHLTRSERILLYRLGLALDPGSAIVELGSYLGASSAFLAAAASERGSTVYCVDTWHNEGMTEGPRDTFEEFLANTRPYVEHITPLRGASLEVAQDFPDPVDLLFVDADHSYQACRADAEAWLPKVRPGGIVVFHDYSWADGVQRAVAEVVAPIAESHHELDNTYWATLSGRHA